MAHYLDTSALVKLIVAEAETAALRTWLETEPRDPVTSDLARAELIRAARRVAPDRAVAARQLLEAMIVVEVATAVFEEAGRLDPAGLRTLDAVHLAAALDLGDDLTAIVTYDNRLADAAQSLGIAVVAPA